MKPDTDTGSMRATVVSVSQAAGSTVTGVQVRFGQLVQGSHPLSALFGWPQVSTGGCVSCRVTAGNVKNLNRFTRFSQSSIPFYEGRSPPRIRFRGATFQDSRTPFIASHDTSLSRYTRIHEITLIFLSFPLTSSMNRDIQPCSDLALV